VAAAPSDGTVWVAVVTDDGLLDSEDGGAALTVVLEH
jgi:hypothetical protein